MKKKLLVLCGGQSSEHIVSRMSCTSVLNNLDKEIKTMIILLFKDLLNLYIKIITHNE